MTKLEPFHRNRQGLPISALEAHELLRRPSYRVVAKETLDNGCTVLTIWTSGHPLFETNVFSQVGMRSVDRATYETELEAQEGHIKLARKWEQGG